MKVLVTGAHGYIATNLKKHLEAPELADNRMSVELLSVRDGNWQDVSFRNFDAVVHAAAIVHQGAKKCGEEEFFKVNAALPVEIARKALAEHIPHFLFFSTMNVYRLEDRRIDGATHPAPCDPYGESKWRAEEGLRELFRTDGASATLSILRPPLVYGPGSPGNFSRLVRLIRLLPVFPELESVHSMVYVETLCEFVRQLLLTPRNGVFHPQNDVCVKTSVLFETAAKLLRRPLWLPSVPRACIRGMERLSPAFSKLARDWTYDMEIDPAFPPALYNVCDFAESMRRTLPTI